MVKRENPQILVSIFWRVVRNTIRENRHSAKLILFFTVPVLLRAWNFRSAGMIMYNLHVCIKGSKLAMDKWIEVSQWEIQCRAKSWFFCFQICLPYRWLVERAKTKWQRLRGSVSHPWSSPWLETNPCETCDPSLRQNYCKVRPKSSSMVSTRSI